MIINAYNFMYLMPVIDKIKYYGLLPTMKYLVNQNKLDSIEPKSLRNTLIKKFVQKFREYMDDNIGDDTDDSVIHVVDKDTIYKFINNFPFLTRFVKDYLKYLNNTYKKTLVTYHPQLKKYILPSKKQ
jgi:hypothetical protein